MQLEGRMLAKVGGALMLLVMATGCAKMEYVGNTSKGFWTESPAKVPPNAAYQKANAFLDATWAARCEKLRHQDEWCDRPPLDHIVRKGSYYYVTRTSFPYENHDAYMSYAVRVHVETGDVIPYGK